MIISDLIIKEIRKNLSLTQEDLANKLGISIRTIQGWEAGKKIPETKHEILRTIYEESLNKNSEKDHDTKVIRYWSDLAATGGGLESFNDVKSDYVPLILPDFRDCTDAVNIIGESMEPTYKSGSIVLLKEWKESFIDFGHPYLIITKNENRMVKILRRVKDDPSLVICESINPNYDPFEIKKEDILRLYLVKGVISKIAM